MRIKLLVICLLVMLASGCASQEQLESVLTQEGIEDFDVHGFAGAGWKFFDGTRGGKAVTADRWTGFGKVQYYAGGAK